MANRYWVGGDGTWDNSDTTHWSTVSGGAGGSSVPTSADDVFFDTNSSVLHGGGSADIISMTSTVSCNNFTSNVGPAFSLSPIRLTGVGTLQIYGSVSVTQHVTSGSSESIYFFCGLKFSGSSVGRTLDFGVSTAIQPDSGGNATGVTFDGAGGDWTLSIDIDENTSSPPLPCNILNGKIITNGFYLICRGASGATHSTMTLSPGVIIDASGGGGLKSGALIANGTSLSHISITGGTVATQTTASVSYIDVTNNTAAQYLGTGTLPFADTHGIDGGGNTNWTFPSPSVSTNAAFLLNFV